MRTHNLALMVLLSACGGSAAPNPAEPVAPAAPDEPATPVATVPDDPYNAALDLDFEQIEDGKPKGWAAMMMVGYESALDRDAHGGASSLRLRATSSSGQAAAMMRSIDATPLRGKRVRLHAWVKTDGVAAPGYAGVWLRVDGGAEMAFDQMGGRGLVGTEGWREATASVDVPVDGTQLVLGPLLVGAGTAWFDDLRLEVTEAEAVKPIELAGVVVDPDGKPAAGAMVSLMSAMGTITQVVTTDAAGTFHLTATTGAWGMSAHHPSGDGAFFDPRELTGDTRDLRLALGKSGGVRVRGTAIASGPLPAGTYVEVAPYSQHVTDGFAIPIGADGHFEARLPRGDRYAAKITAPGLLGTAEANRVGDEVALELRVTVLGPPPAEVNAWVAARAVPLVSAEAGHGFADLKPIKKMIGKAHLVGLGEATHGTREFFQLKHRFVEYLVSELGFTVFAIEANLPECRAINAYVLEGKGDPRAALDGIYFWTWNTEEVLAMIEWMRAWNADPKHARKRVQFVGFDIQVTKVAHANLAGFLAKVAPAEAEALMKPLAPYTAMGDAGSFAGEPADVQAAAVARIAELEQRFTRDEKAWTRAIGKPGFLDAREDLRVIAQSTAMVQAADGSFGKRDLAMADNVDGILRRQPKGTKVVLWAHNAHVATELAGLTSMGSHLRKRHGKDYVVFGFAFGEGSFQAIDGNPNKGGLSEHTVSPPPVTDVSAPFRATGKPIVVVDLRGAPRGPVASWLAAPHPTRSAGSMWFNEQALSQPSALTPLYDVLIYVDKTTRARPNPTGERAPAKP